LSEDETVVPKHLACVTKWKRFRSNHSAPLKQILIHFNFVCI